MTAIIKSGAAAVGNNILPPGMRVGFDTTVSQLHARSGSSPVGGPLTVRINKNGVVWQTVVIPAATPNGSLTGLSSDLVTGDILTFDITTVGTTAPGSDIALDIVGS